MLNIEFSNINETVLMLNGKIFFNEQGRRQIEMKIPTIGEALDDSYFNTFLGVLHLGVDDFKDHSLGFAYNNKGQLFLGLIAFREEYRILLLEYLLKYIHNLTEKNGFLYADEEIITENEMAYIIDVFLVSTGYKKLEEVDQQLIAAQKEEKERLQNLSPTELRYEETLKKLAAAKERQNKKQKQESNLTFDKIIIGVMETFKYTIEDIKKMSYFALYHLFGYVFKIDSYDIMKQVYANGNLKEKTKLTHWLD